MLYFASNKPARAADEHERHCGNHLSSNDASLIDEAVRRVVTMRGHDGTDRDLVVEAVRAEAARGTRSMFGLVKAGARAER